MGGKKRDEVFDAPDDVSEMGENRPTGDNAELFSQPLGFIPRFPAPPKYIKVKSQNRRRRSFDRVFLAQVLLGEQKRSKDTKPSDAQIVSIDEIPAVPDNQNAAPTGHAIWAMEFSKDGKYLAAAGQDKKLRVWAVISSPEERDSEERMPENGFTPGSDGVKLNAPVFKTKLVREYDGHTSSILDLSWSKNNFLLSSSMDKTVRLYHVSRVECLCAFKHNDFVTSIQFHPKDDRFFLAGSLDSKLRLWSIPDKTVAYWAQVPDMITAVAFTPDGKTALAGCLNGMCILYDTEGLRPHSQIHVKSARGRNAKGSKITGIDTIAIPRDNAPPDIKLLITSNDSRVRMYNLKDKNLEIKFRGNENSCSQIHATFSDDGQYVICGSEDRKVYIWPTGPVEKGDPEKRPVEVFEAASAIVTTALLAPTRTKRLLAHSGDPVYDICNPPPVTLRSRSDSFMSSKPPTEGTGHSGDKGAIASVDPMTVTPPEKSEPQSRPLETPAYLARHTHGGGHVIVTADYTGQIKVFRHDCAYQKRRQETWDNNSGFSKKMLGRSGSVTTRTSGTSSLNNHRQSLNLSQKNPSADRIINWRNSVSETPSAPPTAVNGTGSVNRGGSLSEVNLRKSVSERARSSSPKKSLAQRFSIRHGSSALGSSNNKSDSNNEKNDARKPSSTPNTTPGAALTSPQQHVNTSTASPPPEIAVSSPTSPNYASPENPYANPHRSPPRANNDANSNSPSSVINNSHPTNITNADGTTYNPVGHDPNDPLFLLGSQSFMYWNVNENLGHMVDQQPRTPGPDLLGPNSGGSVGTGGARRNPLSRQGSYVGQLSSERLLSEDEGGVSAERGGGSDNGGAGDHLEAQKRRPAGSNTSVDPKDKEGSTAGGDDDLKCSRCGNETFKMGGDGLERGLRCRRCGTPV